MKFKNKKEVLSLIMAILSIIVLCSDRVLYLKDLNIFSLFKNNILISSIIMVALYKLYYKFNCEKHDKRVIKYSLILSIFFSAIEVVGFYLENTYSFFNYEMNKYTIIYNILIFFGWLSIFYIVLCVVIKKLLNVRVELSKREFIFFTNNKRSIITVALFLILFWIIYYFIFYSGVVTQDTYYQLQQSLGFAPLTNHHPFAHTLIVGLFTKIGILIFGNINSGIAFYTFIQMCTIAIIVSCCIKYLAYKNISIKVRIIILLFYAIHPVIAIYSITVWKDIWMGVFNLTYVIVLYELILNPEKFFSSKKKMILLFINVLLILFSKATGIAIIFLSLIAIIITQKTQRKKILAIFVCSIVIFYGINTASQKILGVKPAHIREALSVPIQQISRTIKYHYNELTEEEKNDFNEILPVDKLGELYYPIISDNTKRVLNEDNVKKNPLKYIKRWIELGVKHPYTYVDSFLANTFGYWYPNTTYWIVTKEDYFSMKNYWQDNNLFETINDENLSNYEINETRNKLKENIVNIIDKETRKVPVLGCLFSIGFYLWINLICLSVIIIKKEYKLLSIYFVLIANFFICLISPVYSEFRYAYPFLTTLPFIILFTVLKPNNELK